MASISRPFHLQPHDRVVFYGDSITEQQLYTVYVEAFVRTRFPEMEISFFNRGWGGDTAWGQTDGGPVEVRAERDVAPLNPTVLTVMMGMNDGGYLPYEEETHRRLQAEYARMVRALKRAAPSARVTLIRTSPWDQYTSDPTGPYPGAPFPPQGYNDALLRYGEIVREMAEENGFQFVDFNLPMVDVMREGKEKDVALANQIVPDWIHPGPAGHLIMAGELLKAWGAPSLVSSVVVDIASETVQVENAAVDWHGRLSWSETDGALPFCAPEDPAIQFVSNLYDFAGSLNRQSLTVKGLPTRQHELRIDGEPVAIFSGTELAAGVNLALYDTPMRRQALSVLDLAAKRSMLEMTRWRQIEVKYDSRSALQASHALREVENEVLRQETAMARPKQHDFTLTG